MAIVRKHLPAFVIATVGTVLFYFIGQLNNVDFSFAYNSLVFAFLFFAATYRSEPTDRPSEDTQAQ